MKRFIILLLLTPLFSGCAVTIVYAPKSVEIEDSQNVGVTLNGSDLKDVDLTQSADGNEVKAK